jgi:hypothetical protein
MIRDGWVISGGKAVEYARAGFEREDQLMNDGSAKIERMT